MMTEFKHPPNCLCANLRSAARKLSRIYDAALDPAGINVGQFAALATLEIMGEATVTELASQLDLERTALTRNLAVLERGGLVESRVGEDRRERYVTLSHGGRDRLATAKPLWEGAQVTAVRKLGDSKATTLLQALHDLP